MTGQDAANTAAAFGKALPLTGVILTKTDGDARGGAALSVRYLTGKPIKFLGVGEKLSALEPFYPDRVAARILGMGDVVGLVEAAQQHVDVEQAQKLAQKVKKGGFDLEDFREQFRQLQKMGGITSMLDKLPGMGKLPATAVNQLDDRQVRRMEAIINSMTPTERRKPDLLNGSRKRRIAAGSGTQVQDVNRLLKQFEQLQRMMKQMRKGGGIQRLMQQFKGRMPPGMG
jgi:signal recognition particle subunit SRP54